MKDTRLNKFPRVEEGEYSKEGYVRDRHHMEQIMWLTVQLNRDRVGTRYLRGSLVCRPGQLMDHLTNLLVCSRCKEDLW